MPARNKRTSFVRANLYSSADMSACEVGWVAGGEVGFFTTRSPVKETVNEDAVAILPCGEDAVVLAIADGVGGFRGGEQASRIALDTLRQSVEAAAPGERLRDAILTGIEQANRVVLDLGIGAATTLAAVEVQGKTVRTYHVGDSMALVVGQRGRIKLQTISHSPVGYAVEAGLMDEGEAMHHEERHLVSNVIGSADMRVEIGSTLTLDAHDTVLLASDGLFDNLQTQEIAEFIRCGRLERSLDRMIVQARERMAGTVAGTPCKPDDLAVLVYRPRVRRPSATAETQPDEVQGARARTA